MDRLSSEKKNVFDLEKVNTRRTRFVDAENKSLIAIEYLLLAQLIYRLA